jgi:hypothetical protein
MIGKIFETHGYVSLGKLAFPWGTIMSPGRRSLSYFREQLKPFFLREQSCPWRRKNLSFSREQMCSKFCSIMIFAYEL